MPAAPEGFPPPAGQPLLAGEEKRGASERGEGTGTLHLHRPGSPRTRVFRLLVLNPGRDLGSRSPLSPSLRPGTKKSSLASPFLVRLPGVSLDAGVPGTPKVRTFLLPGREGRKGAVCAHPQVVLTHTRAYVCSQALDLGYAPEGASAEVAPVHRLG